MKKIALSLLLALPLGISAQKLQVKNNIVDLGQVLWMQPATATFDMKNVSNSDITISNMESGCNCTQVDYPNGMIHAGTDFKVNATYDCKQLGHFQRDIAIYVKDVKEPIYITVKGEVVSEITNFTGNFPYTIGGLQADANTIEFDDIHKGETAVQDIHIMNTSNRYIQPTVMHLPNYLRAEIKPVRLAPKSIGTIHFVLNSSKINSFGLSQANIYLAQNLGENVSEDKVIDVSVVILPKEVALDDYSRIRAPKILLSATSVDFTNFKGKTKKKAEIVITNKGKKNLDITSLQMFTQGLEITLDKRTLMPNESTKMKITGYADGLSKVRTRPRILMITNDPDKQKVVIEIKK